MATIATACTRAAAALFAALLLAGAPTARAELVTIELAYETDNASVSLPDAVGRSVTLPGCGQTCPASVRLTADTTYFVGDRKVSFADFRAHLARGSVQLVLFYDPKTLVLNRVKAY